MSLAKAITWFIYEDKKIYLRRHKKHGLSGNKFIQIHLLESDKVYLI